MFKKLLWSIFSSEVNERHLKFEQYYFALYHFSLLYPTTQHNILRCGIHYRRFICGVEYNRRKLFWCEIQRKKTSALSLTKPENFPKHPENVLWCIPQQRKTSSFYHTKVKYLPLYPTMEENLFRCIRHRKKRKTEYC